MDEFVNKENIEDDFEEMDELENEPEDDKLEDIQVVSRIEIPNEFVPHGDPNDLAGPFYKTSYVAEQLGVNRQTVIRYARMFKEYLAIRINPVGERQYTDESIKQLAFLINDRISNGRTLPAELEYIKGKYGSRDLKLASQPMQVFEEMFNVLQDNIIKNNSMLMQQMMDESQKRIEESNSVLEKLEERFERQDEAYSAALSAKDREIERLQTALQEKENELKSRKKRFWQR